MEPKNQRQRQIIPQKVSKSEVDYERTSGADVSVFFVIDAVNEFL